MASTSLGRSLGRIEDLGHVAAAVHVRLARPVAALAGHTALAMHLGDFGVRIVGKFLRDLFVAGRAGVGTNELARIGLLWPALAAGLSPLAGAAIAAAQQHECAQQKHETTMHDLGELLAKPLQ